MQVQVLTGATFLAASDVRYNATNRESLNVLLDSEAAAALQSEYETLTSALSSHYKGDLRDLQEKGDRQDITYLANKTGWDARMVAMTALASQFGARSGIEPEFYYALFRAGAPANEMVLSQMAPETVRQAWERAVEQGILPAELGSKIPRSLKRFKAYSAGRLLEEPAQVGVSSFRALIENSLENAERQQRFAQLYYEKRDDLAAFWEAVRAEFPDEVGRLQSDGKLAVLTINNAPLVRRLRAQRDDPGAPLDLVRGGLYRRETWRDLLSDDVPIPNEIPGEDLEEKRANYALFMACQLRLSYPTAVVTELVREGTIPVRAGPAVQAAVTEFLDTYQGTFELGLHPVERFLRENDIALEAQVLDQIKKLQRVYQISPSYEAMAALLQHDLDYAYAVTRYDRQRFVQTFANRTKAFHELADDRGALRWTVTLLNPTEKEQWLEPVLSLPLPFGDTREFFDGSWIQRKLSLPRRRDAYAHTMPFAAAAGTALSVGVGLDPHDAYSALVAEWVPIGAVGSVFRATTSFIRAMISGICSRAATASPEMSSITKRSERSG